MEKQMLKRTKYFILVIITIFIVLTARLAYMQIMRYDYYWDRAERNRLRILPITAPRGEIFDRNGQQLVANRPGFTVSLVDLGQGYSRETIQHLGGLLEMEEEEIWRKIDSQFYRRYLPIRLKADVALEIVAQISERRLDLPGVVIEVQPIRNYVYGDFASHVLGYLGEGTVLERIQESWQEAGCSYHPGDLVGQAGIELIWEPLLRGKDGGIQVEVNSTGQAIREFERVEPEPGSDLYLTLDLTLQKTVEAALAETAERLVLEENNSLAGEAAAVVLDPNNGRILAMASIPSYDLNTFRQDYPKLETNKRRPLINKTIGEHYPVGSVFKMVTAMAALEEGMVSPGDTVYCGGSLTRYGATKSCYRGTVHGNINIVDALKKSCNIFFYEMGLRVGIDKLSFYAREFGFGAPVGLQDIPGEKPGIVASREYKEQLYHEPWYPAETMDAAIGQSFQSITPLQLVNYVAMIANGGVHYRPYLVEKIVDHEGSTVMMAEPEVLGRLEAKEASWEIIKRGMQLVTEPGGTAASLGDLPVKVAGKTGTAQVVGKDRDISPHGFFVAYAPAEKPEIALVVFVKHGGTGGTIAVPIARRILEHYFSPVENDDDGDLLELDRAQEPENEDVWE
jgi:penicillin-binding protein 2